MGLAHKGVYISTATLLADEVNDKYVNFIANSEGVSRTSEKNIAAAINVAISYAEETQTKPFSKDKDVKYAISRQMCTVGTIQDKGGCLAQHAQRST